MNNGTREVKVIKPTLGANAERKLRVAAYCRVSTDSSDQINSFIAQMRYYSDYIRNHESMVFVDIYADEGITGTCINKRDEFKRMLKDCQNRKIDRVLVKSVQRFARNSLECIESVRVLAECGVSVYFESDNIDTKNMNSEMILYIKSAFAQGESISASKRMSTSFRMKMEDGTFVATSAPYGYRLIDKQLIVCPEEAEIVKKIFAWYLAGVGMNAIAATLNRDMEEPFWAVCHIRYILSNEKYIGDTMMQKTYTPPMLPPRNRPNRGERPKYYAEDTHEAIILKEDFEAAQMLRRRREEKYLKEGKGEKLFLSGKIRCRECGWVYKKLIRKEEVFWVCSKKGNSGIACKSRAYSDTEVFSAFVQMYNRFRQNEKVLLDETITQLQNLKTKITMGNSQVAEIDGEIASLSEQNSMYSKLHTKGIIDDVTYFEKTDSIKKQIEDLRVRRNKLLSEDEDERCIEELRHLKRILNDSPKTLSEIDKELFTSIVTNIYAEQNGDITFCLLGELQLRMEVK